MTATTTTFTHHQNACASQLTTAIEGGINYWAKGRNFKRIPKDQEFAGFYLSCDIKADTGEGDAFPTGDKRNGWQHISQGRICEAIERILDPSLPKLMRSEIIDDIRADWNDPDECRSDAETADCVMQIACFGEIVFG